MSITAKDMVERWNHDMNTFIALLFEMCRRTYESRIKESNSLKVRFKSQTRQLGKIKSMNKQYTQQIAKDDFYIKKMQTKINQFRLDKD